MCVGADESVGYYMSLSRFFTFLPYFIMGVYWKTLSEIKIINSKLFKKINVLIVGASSIILIKSNFISNIMLYGSYSYEAAEYGVTEKMFILMVGFNWIIFLMNTIPNIKIPVVSSIGKNTLCIYLMHGFIVKYIGKIGTVFHYSSYGNLLLAVGLVCLILVFFGNNMFGYFISGKWVSEITRFVTNFVAEESGGNE